MSIEPDGTILFGLTTEASGEVIRAGPPDDQAGNDSGEDDSGDDREPPG